jgi:hypothetical protein
MNEQGLTDAWAGLEPTAAARRRIETCVVEWIEATDTSLADEWLGLLKVQPVMVMSLAAFGGFALVLASPLGWLVALL